MVSPHLPAAIALTCIAFDREMKVQVFDTQLEAACVVLGRRRDKDGRVFLTPDLIEAAERLREDFELAQMGARVAQNWEGAIHEIPRGEIALPLVTGHLTSYPQYRDAAIVHAASGHPVEYKLRLLFSIFAGRFLFDSQLAFFNILEM